MLAQATAAFVMLFVTVAPIELAPIFLGVAGRATPERRRAIALKATLIGGGVLVAFAVGGEAVLTALGIGLPAFRIAGGILLLLISIDLLLTHKFGLSDITAEEEKEAHKERDVAVFPLAIPLIAGPGAMTAMVLLMDRAGADPLGHAVVYAMLAAVLLIGFVSMLAATRISLYLGVTGMNVLSRLSGLILAALAVQFVIDGIATSGLIKAP